MNNINYNPDVLTCLANLSNDEVFTPPNLANEVLDLLPKEIWHNKDVTFLDPCSKSGVFLREITKRLLNGLEEEFPNLQDRIDHILKNQVFGIGITELTSLLSRRSLYCSKDANEKFSITKKFKNNDGNIFYKNISHDWKNLKCKHCGASKNIFNRKDYLDQHAYNFIHYENLKEIFDMKFDVIIGNPPYQLADGGGGGSALPIYNKFIETAKKLNPSYISMIIPSRWFARGRGLDQFRKDMLNDNRISHLIDYPSSNECFPGVQIEGGVCYFLWDKNFSDDCLVTTIKSGEKNTLKRPLLEEGLDFFVRHNDSIPILRKIFSEKSEKFNSLVSSLKPYGLRTYFRGAENSFEGSVKVYQNGGFGFIDRQQVTVNIENLKKHKVFIGRAYGMGNNFPTKVINEPFYGEPNSICTETYLEIGPFKNKETCNNVISYMRTKFFRFIVLLIKSTQDAPKSVYRLAPIQDFNQEWDDDKLYKKYNLSKDEIGFIESLVKDYS